MLIAIESRHNNNNPKYSIINEEEDVRIRNHRFAYCSHYHHHRHYDDVHERKKRRPYSNRFGAVQERKKERKKRRPYPNGSRAGAIEPHISSVSSVLHSHLDNSHFCPSLMTLWSFCSARHFLSTGLSRTLSSPPTAMQHRPEILSEQVQNRKLSQKMHMAADCIYTGRHSSSQSFGGKSICFNLNSRRKIKQIKANLIMNPDSFEVGRLIGSYGFINITSYKTGFQSGLDFENSSLNFNPLRRVQDVGEGTVKIRLYEGRIVQGPRRDTPIIFKVYPGKLVGGVEADMMAANELNAHAFLQSSSRTICHNIQILLGGFETKTGEQWLAFRNDGKFSAADYAKASSDKLSKNAALGERRFWNPFNQEMSVKNKRFYITKLLHGALRGLAYMHDHDRLHQSLGPASVILNTMFEKEADYLVPRLRDLAFSVDIRYSSLEETSGILSEGLWRRASAAGAFTPMEKRTFGIADDIYEAGLLFAYLAFIPFSEAGIFDSLSLQRLIECTFQLDLEATREYCLADDRLFEGVKYLDMGDGAGWELLQAMLNPDFRRRPIAEAVVKHRFLTGALL